MTPQRGRVLSLFAAGRRRRFTGWVREVHADLEALKRQVHPETAENCIRSRVKKGLDVSHVSSVMGVSISMMKMKSFDGALIDQIAADLGMHDRRFCRSKEILLRRRGIGLSCVSSGPDCASACFRNGL